MSSAKPINKPKIARIVGAVFAVIAFIVFCVAAGQCGHRDHGIDGYKIPESGCVPLIYSFFILVTIAFVVGCFVPQCLD